MIALCIEGFFLHAIQQNFSVIDCYGKKMAGYHAKLSAVSELLPTHSALTLLSGLEHSVYQPTMYLQLSESMDLDSLRPN